MPNLETFLTRQRAALAVTSDPANYRPGDVVTWRLPDGAAAHGDRLDAQDPTAGIPLIAHNIGAGPRVEDMLFALDIHGHFRWHGPR